LKPSGSGITLLTNQLPLYDQAFMPKLYVSNQDESARLFKSDFLEKFTHVHWSVPILLYVPASIYFLTRPFEAVLGVGILLFLIGVLTWTFTEYMLHRFVFHYQPSTALGKRVHFLAHGVHHDYPNDSSRLVMPPSVSLPLAVLFYVLFSMVLPAGYLPVFFAGFLLGYVCYDTIHYATHHAPMKGKLGGWLRRHHLRHHYMDDERAFGVSTPLWDYLFRTMHEREDHALQQERPAAVDS
jgi:sterol desaturase/sphingolipid hydroxylase (fatty acid hydroxylase superfamily)